MEPLSLGEAASTDQGIVVAASTERGIVVAASTGWVVPSSTAAAVYSRVPSMVVASRRNWSGVRLQFEEDLLFLVGRRAPSTLNQHSHELLNDYLMTT